VTAAERVSFRSEVLAGLPRLVTLDEASGSLFNLPLPGPLARTRQGVRSRRPGPWDFGEGEAQRWRWGGNSQHRVPCPG
jgi:hypothetical protein